MSNAARPLHRISAAPRGESTEEMLGRWAVRNTARCEPHFSYRCPRSGGTAVCVPTRIETDLIIYSLFLTLASPRREFILYYCSSLINKCIILQYIILNEVYEAAQKIVFLVLSLQPSVEVLSMWQRPACELPGS